MCGACRRGCANQYTEQKRASLKGHRCEVCNGSRMEAGHVCSRCLGSGEFTIVSCPQPLVTPDIRAALAAADFARKGCLPIAGGTLDQAAGIMAAIRCVWNEEAGYRNGSEE